jgi:hypothetical protein
MPADEAAAPAETTASEPPPGAPPPIPEMPEPSDLQAVPEDADDTRGHHFRRLLRSPVALIVGGIAIGGAFVGGTAGAGAAIGAAAAGGMLLLTILVVFLLANSAAAEDFFTAYAQGRSLSRVPGKTDLPPVTPLLRKGDRRYAEQRFNGVLPGGLDGSLCLYTYEETSTDSDGNRQTSYLHYTITMTQLPDTAPFIHELYAQRRFGFRFLDSAEDVFRKRQRVEHESENVDKRFELFIGEPDDMNKARQILSPQFLVWLDEHCPEAFAFELVAGSLVCHVKGHKKAASELDSFCTASAAVARRLHDEVTELGPASAPPPPQSA